MARPSTPNQLPVPANKPAVTLPNRRAKPGDPPLTVRFDDTKGGVEFPVEYEEALAKQAIGQYYRAKQWRTIARLGDTTVEETLRRCWRQVEGEIDPCTLQMIEETGVDLVLNLSELKVDAFEAWARSVIADSAEMPWTVDPTPIPSLSAAMKQELLDRVKARVFDEAQAMPEDMVSLVRQMKGKLIEEETNAAARAAANMERRMKDQAIEGGFRQAILGVIRDFATYPYCVLEGPYPTVTTQLEWRGNRLVPVDKMISRWRRRSPFDLFWSADSSSTQQGSYIILRERMTRADLMKAAQLRSYIQKNVLAALEYFGRNATMRDWLNPNPERNNNTIWPMDESIDVLTKYGLFSANELRPYGLSLHDGQFYEAKVKVLGPYAIQVHINHTPNPFTRPVHTASMTTNGEKIPGKGLCQKVRDIERAYHAALRGLIRNSHYSSGPIGEVDFSRIARWIADDQIGGIDPYTIMPVDPDIAGGGRPAHYFHNVQNIASAMIAVMEYFERVADRHTQIPAAFHGEAVGTGVNRTFRGVTLLQGNALKGIQSALTNLGKGVIEPAARTQFTMNMLFDPDDSIKGDCTANIRDVGGLLEREMKKQQTLELLQLVGQVAQAGEAPPGVVGWAVSEALKAAGVPLDKFDEQFPVGGRRMGAPALPNSELGAPAGLPVTPPKQPAETQLQP